MEKSGSNTIASVALFALAFSLFLPTLLNGDFLYDDKIHLLHNLLLRRADGWKEILLEPAFPGSLYRPVTFLSYWSQVQLFGLEARPILLGNGLLHAVNVVLIYFLMIRLNQRKYGLGVGLLFAVHPIHTEAIVNGVGRAELLAFFFGLTGVHCCLSRNFRLAAIPFLLSVFSKESGAVFPMLAYLTLWQRGEKPSKDLFYCLVLTAFSLALARYFVIGSLGNPHPVNFVDNPLAALSSWDRAANAFSLLGRYVLLSFVPFPLSADYSFATLSPCLLSDFNPLFLLSSILSLFLFIFGGVASWNRRFLGFALLWFFIAFLITSNVFFPIGTIFAERLAYTPSLGICIVLVFLFLQFEAVIARVSLTLLFLIGYSLVAIDYQQYWTDEGEFFERQVRVYPDSVKMLGNLAIIRRTEGRYEEAEGLLTRAQKIYPFSADIPFIQATVHIEQGKEQLGKSLLELALKRNPGHVEALLTYGRLMIKQREFERADTIIRRGLELEPDHQKLLVSLFLLKVASNQWKEAFALEKMLLQREVRDEEFRRVRSQVREVIEAK